MDPVPAKPKRSAGRWAYDWCFLPLGVYVILMSIPLMAWRAFGLRRTLKALFPPLRAAGDILQVFSPASIPYFLFGVLLAAHWVWGLRAVILTWRDPVVKFRRFASALLLLFYIPLILCLLRLPFEKLR